MTYEFDVRGKIHNLQGAIWKLEAACELIETVNGAYDPELDQIQRIITRLRIEMDQCWEQNG